VTTLCIIPTYNEKENLERVVRRIRSLELPIQILIVDDNSPDGTGKYADQLAERDSFLTVIHRQKKEGIGAAYLAGLAYAIEHTDAEYIFEMDADLSHDPGYIPLFLEKISDCDVVLGSRFYRGRVSIVNWPLSRLILSYGARVYVKLFSRLRLDDPTSGFRCFRRRVVERLLANKICSREYAFHIEVSYVCSKMGFAITEVPIVFYERDSGQSKMCTLKTVLEAVLIVWKLKFKTYA